MKPMKRALLVTLVALFVVGATFTAGWLTAGSGASPQETGETQESTTEEPLTEFQPTERLPADSAVAFPTDI